DDAVGFTIERNSGATDGLVARVELKHRVGNDAHNLDGVGIDELEDASPAAGFGRLIQLLDDRGDRLQFVLRAADDETVAGGQRGFEPDDPRLLLAAAPTWWVELANDAFDAGNLLLRTADHDPIVLGFCDERGRSAQRFGRATELLGVKLLHERRELRGRAAA